MDEITRMLLDQDGVIARRQVLALGGTEATVRRMLRRREWVVVHPGVYVNHTGPLTWRQRAWAAVLVTTPAALGGRSAIRAHDGPGRREFDDTGRIEVVVPHHVHPASVDGIRFRRSRRFDESVQLHLSPPRQRYDDAVLELADRTRTELDAIAVLADACGSRRTTAARLQQQLARMSRVARREWLNAILTDVAEGTCSVLEHGYLTRVERAHGLPRGTRQERATDARGRARYRDIVYTVGRPGKTQYVELDGRIGHEATHDRDRDLERACSTAEKVGMLLQKRGWEGATTACPACAAA